MKILISFFFFFFLHVTFREVFSTKPKRSHDICMADREIYEDLACDLWASPMHNAWRWNQLRFGLYNFKAIDIWVMLGAPSILTEWTKISFTQVDPYEPYESSWSIWVIRIMLICKTRWAWVKHTDQLDPYSLLMLTQLFKEEDRRWTFLTF